jgi:hypothetical protein
MEVCSEFQTNKSLFIFMIYRSEKDISFHIRNVSLQKKVSYLT